MNSKLLFAAGIASLFAAIGTAYAQDTPESSQQMPQQKAEAPALMPAPTATTTTSDDATYGGVPSGRSMSASGTRQAQCSTGPNCNIFFGQ
ncbi:hypothetical protein SBC1_61790 (plasmid) [Caballeronia sp. SBC1]|uniref:hypothetical protein n=1 Tax=Caballeronia sp. SBC2 TaxID=2705547 RepID=UPI0013E1E434|nr:hypothetical protein [Caballeronia sp. SBC2]QIE28068.1 hypothetical protein SBC2_61440 [Caballeronia sp. SBC2]QIN66132.1 hypothetical protein SBC1_61790 [Caballeronia sp. SBC1]